MVVVDYFSLTDGYLLQKPNADGVIEVVKDTFSRYGAAEELISDNRDVNPNLYGEEQICPPGTFFPTAQKRLALDC